jgi:predicted porin
MKKTLIALAVLAASGASFAQSSVTLSGVVGMGYQTSSAGVKGLSISDSTIAVGAVEDLGGGLKANFAMAFDATGSTFASNLLRRNTSVGLSGGFGSVTFANTRGSELLTSAMVAPSYLPDGMFDKSGIVNRTQVDVIQYTAPSMSGFTPYLQHVETGTTTTQADGNGAPTFRTNVLGVTYAAGPLAVGLARKNTSGLPSGAVTSNTEAFATYDLGVAKVGVGYDSKMNEDNTNNAISSANAAKAATSFGVAVPVGALTVGANYAVRGTAKVTEFAAKYDLSKRTAVRLSTGKQSVDTSNQNRIAVVHNF